MPGEAAQLLSAANFVRDNIVWSDVESKEGVYNFSRTDELLSAYDAAGGHSRVRWMATLAYSNPLYDGGGPPTSEEGVNAFVAFTVAAVRRYQGRGVLWELWCEPNGVFWDGGKGNVTQYVALAVAVGKGVAAAGLSVTEAFIGPNTAMWWQVQSASSSTNGCVRLHTPPCRAQNVFFPTRMPVSAGAVRCRPSFPGGLPPRRRASVLERHQPPPLPCYRPRNSARYLPQDPCADPPVLACR